MKSIIYFLIASLFISCKKDDKTVIIPDNGSSKFISAVDISSYPEISNYKLFFYDLDRNKKDFLSILKENGINTIRLRLWVNPINKHCSFEEVKEFSQTLKNKGFKIWLTLHYSDTWADPGKQVTPTIWKNLEFATLKDSVYNYTKKVTKEINPNFIQIGNEINSGILHPYGNIVTNYPNFIQLIQVGCAAVRDNSNDCKIILHYAGIENSVWFFSMLSTVDYDIIGLSYYPFWHGKSLESLKVTMQNLSETHKKQIIIAETAYPFTLNWNDWTNNIVGSSDHLILPDYPASVDGQRNFIKNLKTTLQEVKNGIGLCYWGAELVAWKGNQSKDASPWENQALFNFNNEALPALSEFKMLK